MPGGAGFPPDEHFAVVAGGGEDVAIFGVRPGDGPDGAFVAGGLVSGVERGGKGGEVYPFSVSVSRCVSPSTSKILTVRSEEQVARRRP